MLQKINLTDPESLKIILDLQKQVTLYRRAIGDIYMMLHSKKYNPYIVEYDIDDHLLNPLFREIEKVLSPEKENKHPGFTTDPEALQIYDDLMNEITMGISNISEFRSRDDGNL